VACILFVLAAFGAHVGDFSELDVVALGLAFVAAGLLLPGAVTFVSSHR